MAVPAVVGAASVCIGAVVPAAVGRGAPGAAAVLALSAVLLLCAAGARLALLCVIVASIPFQVGVVVGYREEAASVGALSGLDVSVTTVAIAGAWALWLADLLVRADAPRVGARGAGPFAAFVAAVAVSARSATDASLAWFEAALLFESLLLLVLLTSWLRRSRERRVAVGCFLVSGAAQAVLVIVGRFVGGVPGRLDGTVDGSVRSGGTIGSPNTAGGFFAALLVVAVAAAVVQPGERRSSAQGAGVVAALAAIALLLTGSRGAWIGAAIGCLVVGAAAVARGRVDAVRAAVAAAVLLAATVVGGGAVLDRLTGDDGGALSGRGALADMTTDVIADHPVTGIGANNLGPALLEHPAAQDRHVWIYTVHNKYLLVWAEAGFLAVAAFVWFLVDVLVRAARGARLADLEAAAVGLGAGAAVVALAVQMNAEPFSSRPQIQLLVLLAALVHATAPSRSREAIHA